MLRFRQILCAAWAFTVLCNFRSKARQWVGSSQEIKLKQCDGVQKHHLHWPWRLVSSVSPSLYPELTLLSSWPVFRPIKFSSIYCSPTSGPEILPNNKVPRALASCFSAITALPRSEAPSVLGSPSLLTFIPPFTPPHPLCSAQAGRRTHLTSIEDPNDKWTSLFGKV